MKLIRICGCHVWRFREGCLSFQLHLPRISIKNKDFYAMFPTVLRIICGAKPMNDFENLLYKEYGFGLIMLGFGAAIIWKVKNKSEHKA